MLLNTIDYYVIIAYRVGMELDLCLCVVVEFRIEEGILEWPRRHQMEAIYRPSHLPSLHHCEEQNSFRYDIISLLEDRVSTCLLLHRLYIYMAW